MIAYLCDESRNLFIKNGPFLEQHRDHDQSKSRDKRNQKEDDDNNRCETGNPEAAYAQGTQPVNDRIQGVGQNGSRNEWRQNRTQQQKE